VCLYVEDEVFVLTSAFCEYELQEFPSTFKQSKIYGCDFVMVDLFKFIYCKDHINKKDWNSILRAQVLVKMRHIYIEHTSCFDRESFCLGL